MNDKAIGVGGLKHDDGKLRMDLIPPEALESLAEVLMYGAAKYDANSWQGVEPSRYLAALLRHLTAHMRGEKAFRKEHKGCKPNTLYEG